MLRVRNDTYWRIELPSESERDKGLAEELKGALAKVLQYEATPCPFKRGFHVELPERSPKIKRPWRAKHQPVHADASDFSPLQVKDSPRQQRSSSPLRHSFTATEREDESTLLPNGSQAEDSFDSPLSRSSKFNPASVERHVTTYEDLSASGSHDMAHSQVTRSPTPRSHANHQTLTSVAIESIFSTNDVGVHSGQRSISSPGPALTPENQKLSEFPGNSASLPGDRSLHEGFDTNGGHVVKSDCNNTLQHLSENDSDSLSGENVHVGDLATAGSSVVPAPAETMALFEKENARQSISQASPLSSKEIDASGFRWLEDANSLSLPTHAALDSQDSQDSPASSLVQTALQKGVWLQQVESDVVQPHSTDSEFTSLSSSTESFCSVRSCQRMAPSIPPSSLYSSISQSVQEGHDDSNGRSEDPTMLSSKAASPGNISGPTVRSESLKAPHSFQEPPDPLIGNTHDFDASHSPFALRRQFVKRRRHSPPPEPANLYLPSTRSPGAYLTSHLFHKTCNLLLGPPAQIVALMLNLAARIANGASPIGPFSYDAKGMPCAWDSSEGESSSEEWQDDFGISLGEPGVHATRSQGLGESHSDVD